MNHIAQVRVGAFIVLLFVSLGEAVADDFSINRHTIDGGGVMVMTGGGFELSGTIGQPTTGVMSGDEFTLIGGFWFERPPGDCDSDGDVDTDDYSELAACLGGPGGGLAGDCNCFDFDGDTDVDLTDFAEFQGTFTG